MLWYRYDRHRLNTFVVRPSRYSLSVRYALAPTTCTPGISNGQSLGLLTTTRVRTLVLRSVRTMMARTCRIGLLLDDHEIRVVGEDTEKNGVDQPGHRDPVGAGLRHRVRVPGI